MVYILIGVHQQRPVNLLRWDNRNPSLNSNQLLPVLGNTCRRLSSGLFVSMLILNMYMCNRFDMNHLYKFTLTVRKNYRSVPYHNWAHAFSVAHAMFTVIKTTGCIFTPIEVCMCAWCWRSWRALPLIMKHASRNFLKKLFETIHVQKCCILYVCMILYTTFNIENTCQLLSNKNFKQSEIVLFVNR